MSTLILHYHVKALLINSPTELGGDHEIFGPSAETRTEFTRRHRQQPDQPNHRILLPQGRRIISHRQAGQNGTGCTACLSGMAIGQILPQLANSAPSLSR